ncbi:MAG: PLP-dependent aminotransferase family protein [Chromatiales bacterium]|nr:PLP-dependent aminotransferase family protein [Chromatiales bacterium]
MTTRYERLAADLIRQIEGGVYRPGDRLPGVRKLAAQQGVSVSTAVEAFRWLEDRGRIEARPRSGFYVRAPQWQPPAAALTEPPAMPTPVSGHALVMRLVRATMQPGLIQLGAAVPDAEFLPVKAVQRAFASASRRYGARTARYDFPPGAPELRREIARRLADAGCRVTPDEIVITSGCLEAMSLGLRAVARPGDVIAIESPTFYGLLQVIESLGMKALEIPTHPVDGISLEALRLAIEQWPVAACALTINHSNPFGNRLTDAKKQALVEMLAARRIPLIEDDIYGELGFDQMRPPAAKAWDRDGGVIHCGSVSKTIAPGLRIGWAVPGRWQEQVEFLKYDTNLATATLPQLAVAEFLAVGGYDRHLRRVRDEYARLIERTLHAVTDHFPAGTRVTRPSGGFVLWVELPEGGDAMVLHRQALGHGITIAPGPIFSATQRYRNCLRLTCAQPWSERMEQALRTLGRLAAGM